MISDRARLRCFDSMMMMEFRCSLSCSSSPSQVSILRRCAPSCCVARHVTECAYVCHVPLVVLVPRSAISRSARHRQLWYATRQAAQHQGWHAAQATGHGAYSVGVQVGDKRVPERPRNELGEPPASSISGYARGSKARSRQRPAGVEPLRLCLTLRQ